MKKNKNIGFIGAGNIATSLIAGLIKQKVNRKNIFSSSPDQADLDNLSNLIISEVEKRSGAKIRS